MAITWGAGKGSGNLLYVGIDVTGLTPTSATVTLYVKAQYRVSDTQTMTWSNAASGSRTFTHSQSGGAAVSVASFTVSGSAGQTKTVSAALSGVYNGANPTHALAFTFPQPSTLPPNAPGGLSASYVSDTTVDVAWNNAAAANRPVDRYRVERYDWSNAGAGYVFVGNTTGLSLRVTGHKANAKYSYRVRAENSAGQSGYTAWGSIMTTPAAPASVTLTRLDSGALRVGWVDMSPYNDTWDAQWLEGSGSWSASTSLSNASTSADKTGPNPTLSHTARVRAVVGGRVSAWATSNVLSLLSRPGLPTGLASGVLDPAVSPAVASWRFTSTDGSPQQAYEVRWRLIGASGWTTSGVTNTAGTSRTWPAGTFAYTGPGSGLEWQVNTKGLHADWSGWSATSAFQFAPTPGVALTSPTDPLTSTTIRVGWTTSEPQSQWRVSLADASGAVLETRTGSGTTQSVELTRRAAQGGTYTLTVESRSQAGLWSEPAVRTFTARFPLPEPITPTVAWDVEHGWATVDFDGKRGATHAWTGAPNASASTRTIGGEAFTNLATNPSFEAAGAAVEVRRNLIPNPRFVGRTGWQMSGGGGNWAASGPHTDPDGSQYARLTVTAPGKTLLYGALVTGAIGDVVTGAIEVRPSVSMGNTGVSLSNTGAADRATRPAGVWTRCQTTGTMTTTSVYLYLNVDVSTVPVGAYIDVRFPTLEKGSGSGPYFDGSTSPDPDLTPGWLGAANASASVLTGVGVAGTPGHPTNGSRAIQSPRWSERGSKSVRVTGNPATGDTFAGVDAFMPHRGKRLTILATLHLEAPLTGVAGPPARRMFIYSASAGLLYSPQAPNVAGDHQIRWTVDVPSDASYLRLMHGHPTSESVWWDSLTIVEGAYSGDYFDGSMPSTVTPDTLDLWRQDHPAGQWELVAEGVPWPGVTITDTEAGVDGRAVWVARATNTALGTTVDGPTATSEASEDRGYLSGGDGYEVAVPLIWGPEPRLTHAKERQVLVLDGGDRPRRVLVETPATSRELAFSGRLYGTTDYAMDSVEAFEALALLPGPHLYRDTDGRKLYGALSAATTGRGDRGLWWTVGFGLEEADHDAVVGEVNPSV